MGDNVLPRIGEWKSVYGNPYFQIFRVKADFGQFAKEYFVVEDNTPDPQNPAKRNATDGRRGTKSFCVMDKNITAIFVVTDVMLDDLGQNVRLKLERAAVAEVLRNADGKEVTMTNDGRLLTS